MTVVDELTDPSSVCNARVFSAACGGMERPRWIVFPGMLTTRGQRRIADCLALRIRAAREKGCVNTSKTALGLDMQPANQPACTEPLLVDLAQFVFEQACKVTAYLGDGAKALQHKRHTWTALGWLYGPCSTMKPHFDSPTFEASEHEWLVSFNVGLSLEFSADDQVLVLQSGDVLLMDTLAVKHGVKRVIPGTAPPDCPLKDARLGIMLWESYNPDLGERKSIAQSAETAVEGLQGLFLDSDSDNDEE